MLAKRHDDDDDDVERISEQLPHLRENVHISFTHLVIHHLYKNSIPSFGMNDFLYY